MVMTFREALLMRTGGDGKPSLKAISEKAGVSYEQMKKVRQGATQRTNVDDAIKLAAAMGMTLNEFVEDSLAEDRAIVVSLYNQLTDEERQILRDAARGRGAQAQHQEK
ncbi:hypothetical protein [Paracoccus sp. (in: a-proteobacteria)]|uniref:hypothetical protein n=1 Tax=Paracoccus sp. TaxID=267 RepID=UPI0025837381|nr:hypothetical protein [Paracoccus sp. (in: a-proteobacteria)]